MKLNTTLKLMTAVLIAGLSQSAMATAAASNDLNALYARLEGLANGPLCTGLALMMIIIGILMGVAKNSPLPAMVGLGVAISLKWGPKIISNIGSSNIDINISTMPIFLFTCIAVAWAYVVFLGITAKDSNIVHKPEEPEPKIEEFSVVDETFGKTHIFYNLAQKRINALDITDDMKYEMIKKLDMLASNEVLFSKEDLIEQKNKVMLIIQNFELVQKQALKKSMTF